MSAGLVPSRGSEGESVSGLFSGFWWLQKSLAFFGLCLHLSKLYLRLYVASSCVSGS